MNVRAPTAFVIALVLVLLLAGAVAPGAAPPRTTTAAPACPTSPSKAVGKNFNGRNLAYFNFSRQDLTNADFRNAILQGAQFIGANLTGADFTGATFVETSGIAVTDFSFANLNTTCFIGANFNAPTYLTHATLDCADFSKTDLSNGNAIFGNQRLRLGDSTTCRTAFRQSKMSCEFLADWAALDLSGALLGACASQLSGRDLSNAVMPNVDLTGTTLDGINFTNANLSAATLNNASLQCLTTSTGATQCVDLTSAQLQGAQLNYANLSGAVLYRAFLTSNPNVGIASAASLRYAHLKNANLAFADLSGADFSYANFYGDTPSNVGSGRCKTSGGNDAGVTSGCANAHAAKIAGTLFQSAYLYGLDLTGADITGASFNQAMLAGANFAAAKIGPFAALTTKFTGAYLQGTNLDQAASVDAELNDAFVDFSSPGNQLVVLLKGANHNIFSCPGAGGCTPPTGQDVCVQVVYPLPTTVPVSNTKITCPDGNPAGSGCGVADPGGANPRWRSRLIIEAQGQGTPAGWYVSPPTYPSRPGFTGFVCGNPANYPPLYVW